MGRRNFSRRDFMRQTAARASAAIGVLGASAAAQSKGPNSRLRVGFVGAGSRAQSHIETVLKLQQEGWNVEAAAVCDVFDRYREQTVAKIRQRGGTVSLATAEYRDVLASPEVDVVCIATPDHWHARMTLDALAASKHVYCERPMTRTIDESQQVSSAWRESGCVMQVGVQGTSDGRWRAANRFIAEGGIGKLVQVQSECFRNSGQGQWRAAGLSRDMTPCNIDWRRFLGTEFELAPELPFDRAAFAQWRCYWPFSSGPYSELFVPQLTRMLLAAGLRYPRRVVGSGGIFLEYDGRDVPDTATLIADYAEGAQFLLTGTMINDHPIEHCIRGHYGTLVFDLSRDGFEFLPQRPQVTRQRDLRKEHMTAPLPKDETQAHWENFLEAIAANDPLLCNNTPELGAAAVTTAMLAVESYRQGKVLEWAAGDRIAHSDGGYAAGWEQISRERGEPRHVAGWQPVNQDPAFSRQRSEDFQRLAGPWPDDETDPARS